MGRNLNAHFTFGHFITFLGQNQTLMTACKRKKECENVTEGLIWLKWRGKTLSLCSWPKIILDFWSFCRKHSGSRTQLNSVQWKPPFPRFFFFSKHEMSSYRWDGVHWTFCATSWANVEHWGAAWGPVFRCCPVLELKYSPLTPSALEFAGCLFTWVSRHSTEHSRKLFVFHLI